MSVGVGADMAAKLAAAEARMKAMMEQMGAQLAKLTNAGVQCSRLLDIAECHLEASNATSARLSVLVCLTA